MIKPLLLATLCFFILTGCGRNAQNNEEVSVAVPAPATSHVPPDNQGFAELPCEEDVCISGLLLRSGPAPVAIQTRGVPYSTIEAHSWTAGGWSPTEVLNETRAHPKILEGLQLRDESSLVVWSDWVPPPASAGQGEGAGLRERRLRGGQWSESSWIVPSETSIRSPHLTQLADGRVLLSVIGVLADQRSELLMYLGETDGSWSGIQVPHGASTRYPYEATSLGTPDGTMHCILHTREESDVGRRVPSNVRAFHAVGTPLAEGGVRWTDPVEIQEMGLGGAKRDLHWSEGVLHAVWYDKVGSQFGLFTNQWSNGAWTDPQPLPAEGAAPTGPSFVQGSTSPEFVFAQSDGRALSLGRRTLQGSEWMELPSYGPVPGGQLPRAFGGENGSVEVSWTDMPLGRPRVRTARLPAAVPPPIQQEP